MNTRLPATHTTRRFAAVVGSLGLALSISLAGNVDLEAAPQATPIFEVEAQNVDYISTDASPALDLGFPVLVPSWVPSPFSGSPSIDAGGGYYGLYWMNAGGSPTFLHVTGQVGGALPAGSPYDLNNELFINASVMGYDAIHDVTPAYDAVWWIAGGVLYKVESRNSDVDSLSLANSLITFSGPSLPAPEPTVAPEPEPTDEPVFEEPETEEPGTQAPAEPGSTTNPDSDTTGTGGESGTDESGTDTGSSDGTDSGSDGSDAADSLTNGLTSDGTGQSTVSSDGTGGPAIPAIGGDGTGGTADVYVPRRSTGTQTP